LKAPDIPPVVLHYNDENRNVADYKINTFAISFELGKPNSINQSITDISLVGAISHEGLNLRC